MLDGTCGGVVAIPGFSPPRATAPAVCTFIRGASSATTAEDEAGPSTGKCTAGEGEEGENKLEVLPSVPVADAVG